MLQFLFFLVFVRPLVLWLIGVSVLNRVRLPRKGPVILVANHNSHLDALAIMTLFPLSCLHRLRPVAAADYFLSNPLLRWFSTKVIRIIPLARDQARSRRRGEDPFAECSRALVNNRILIIFPEGSRGEPERMANFRNGITRLLEKHPAVPAVPIFFRGMGKVLPRGAFLPVPFNVRASVGKAVFYQGDKRGFMSELRDELETLARDCPAPREAGPNGF